MTEYLNCNKNIPEYNNICVNNKRDNNITVFNGEKWIIQEKNDTLDNILNKKGDLLSLVLEEKYEKLYNKLSSVTIAKFKQFKKGRYNDEQIEFMKNKLNILLYNNRDVLTKHKKKYL